MESPNKFARPYAKAVFQSALEHNALKAWSERLALASELASQPEMKKLIQNPVLGQVQCADLLITLGKDAFDNEAQQFLRVLARFKRLQFLPNIAALYEAYRADVEKRKTVQVQTAFDLDEKMKNQLIDRLKARFHCDIDLAITIEPALLGGARLQAGDWVLDGSVKGRLDKMNTILGTF